MSSVGVQPSMNIVIHFNTASFIPSSITLPSMHSYVVKTQKKLAMVPGIDEIDQTVMSDDENSMVDIATSNTLYTHALELKNTNHVLGSCFGLPYQDHNYGAPPPPTPPSHSPCTSPTYANGVPDEDTNFSIVSASTVNEEIQDSSITRCICGFEHDDEYMICCDHCLVWQHVDCMGLDRNKIPETYLCEKCEPRKVDRHKAKVLQTRKKVAMTDSSDSDENVDIKNADRKQKNRKRRRKDGNEKSEHHEKRNRQIHKHSKERIEVKRSKLRRTKNKESTSTADEEAQDAWESSLEWCEKNFETAMNNQYTPEVQLLAKKLTRLGHEERLMELLLTRNCKVIDGNQKKLISIYDIPRDQPLIELKGKFLLASQFYDLHPCFSKRLFPYVIFYSLDEDEICVDSSVYGNEARFIRRSCKPNSELRHLVHNGNLHLYISSTKAVFKDDEITLPLDFAGLKEGIKEIECACESEDCIVKLHPKNGNVDVSHDKRRKSRKLFLSADDDSSHSFQGSNISPTKCKSIKNHSQSNETVEAKYETEEQANERRKKTREERKLDAIMRAFDQMEKAEKRRQQALERQKAHHPKTEEISEKSENIITSKEDDKTTTASGSETQCGEEEKVHVPTSKPKKGKRRRGSGTPARRRTRTNSGGSDILSPEENVLTRSMQVPTSDQILNQDSSVETSSIITTSTTSVSSTALSTAPVSPVVLKTKRLLLNEWLQEKSETNINPPTTSSISARSETKWNTTAASSTCYVQCTKDNSHSGGISAAHLRRSSSSSQLKPFPLKSCSEQGFTKKRWLRQAMFDSNSYDEPLIIDPGGLEGYSFDSVYLSPTSHGEMGSPGAIDDTITPLKKRRLLRESVDSPLSPNNLSLEGPVNTSLNSTESLLKLEVEFEESDHQSLLLKNGTSKLPTIPEEKTCKINGLRVDQGISQEPSLQKEGLSSCENGPSLSHKSKSLVLHEPSDLMTSPDFIKVESSMQIGCDAEYKTYPFLKSDNAKEDDDIIIQTVHSILDNVTNNLTTSDDLCADKSLLLNCETEKKLIHIPENVKVESTSENCSAKQVVPLDGNCVQCSHSADDSCSISDSPKIENFASLLYSDTSKVISDAKNAESELLKIPDGELKKKLSEENSSVSITSESVKNNCTDLISDCLEKEPFIIPTENIDVSVSSDRNNDIVDCSFILPKNSLKDVNNVNSESLCGNSVLSNGVNVSNVESSQVPNLDSSSSQLSSEKSSLVSTISTSVTQKRKVSLSEYRLRMKDGSNKRTNSENTKKIATFPAAPIPETLPEKVTLAPLPLFNTAAISKCPPETPLKAPKLKKEVIEDEKECYSDIIEPRENLIERLKREFGYDDESEDIPPAFNSQHKSVSTKTCAMTICAQASSPPPPPASPPPPPPPPRPVKKSLNRNVASSSSSSQFGFNMPTPYARPSYIVSQVSNAQFIPIQQTVNMPVLPSIHPVSAPAIRPVLLPSPHSFAPTMQGTGIQLPVQQEFSSVNAQNYVALVQQPPPSHTPKTFSQVCQQTLYK